MTKIHYYMLSSFTHSLSFVPNTLVGAWDVATKKPSKVLTCGPHMWARETSSNGQTCEIWSVSGGGRRHPGKSSRVDVGAGAEKEFPFAFRSREKPHWKGDHWAKPWRMWGSEPYGNLEEEHCSIWEQNVQRPYCGGWLWKQEKEASVAGIGCKGRIIVEETADLIGDLFNENT